jgi:hypothetical protein
MHSLCIAIGAGGSPARDGMRIGIWSKNDYFKQKAVAWEYDSNNKDATGKYNERKRK